MIVLQGLKMSFFSLVQAAASPQDLLSTLKQIQDTVLLEQLISMVILKQTFLLNRQLVAAILLPRSAERFGLCQVQQKFLHQSFFLSLKSGVCRELVISIMTGTSISWLNKPLEEKGYGT